MLEDNTVRYSIYTIIFLLLLIPMIVLLLKLECKHKNETKGEVESNEFRKYLFNNKSPMHKGFIATFLSPLGLLFLVCGIELYNKLKKK